MMLRRIVSGLPLLAVLLASACAPPPKPQAKVDPAAEAGYSEAAVQLAGLNKEAEQALASGQFQRVADNIEKGLPLQTRLLTAPRPPLAAMEAICDLDDLYARMLLHNGRPGWARLMYQKNVVRWRGWTPATADTERRLKQAQAGLAESDRRIQ